MNRKQTYTAGHDDKGWERLAARLSGEETTVEGMDNEPEIDAGHFTEEMWKSIESIGKVSGETDTGKAWSKLYGRLSEEDLVRNVRTSGPGRQLRLLLRIAASVLILITAGYVTYRIAAPRHEETLTAWSGDAKSTIVNLPDGSQVKLNRNTSLTYPVAFDDQSRTVTLNGEAYFEVAGDPNKAFRVIAGKAVVEVLGTSFNVLVTDTKGEVEVFVTSGKVMLSSEDDTEGVELTKGLIGRTSEGKTLMELNENPNYMAWSSGLLVYDSTALGTVLKDLKRVYGIDIVADESVISDKYITTVFDNTEEEDIIKIIAATFNLSWRKEGRVYLFSQL